MAGDRASANAPHERIEISRKNILGIILLLFFVTAAFGNWRFDYATFERSAESFDNPDFVEVVIQSYRHRFGYAPGDPALEPIEQQLASRPAITVPSIVLQGEGDAVATATDAQARFFTGSYRRTLIPVIGHDVPQEAPMAVADAVLELMRNTT